MNYLSLLTEHVEQNVSELLPTKMALIFDGWSSNSTNYLGLFALFLSNNICGYETRLLELSPLRDECYLDADAHYDFLTYVLGLYRKTWDNVVCLIKDNVNTNKSLYKKKGIPFIGCGSHRVNLAVRDVLQEEEELICKINAIMLKYRGLLLSAKLRKLTYIRPQVRNVTK